MDREACGSSFFNFRTKYHTIQQTALHLRVWQKLCRHARADGSAYMLVFDVFMLLCSSSRHYSCLLVYAEYHCADCDSEVHGLVQRKSSGGSKTDVTNLWESLCVAGQLRGGKQQRRCVGQPVCQLPGNDVHRRPGVCALDTVSSSGAQAQAPQGLCTRVGVTPVCVSVQLH
eukprot:1014500-Pelagomonas_calceolata.AAC.3